MSVGLINWSGHKNLGDDAMARILLDNIPGAVNMKEDPWEADWYILGGGTLISPQSLFPGRLPNPEKTIGVSLGVSCNWAGENVDILKRLNKIYTRDIFSHEKLLAYDIPNTLSVDLLCALFPSGPKMTNGVWANIMYAPESIVQTHKEDLDRMTYELKQFEEVNYFALSPDEDLATIPEAFLYTSAQQLIDDLSGAETIYATRLHANIAAWIAGCKDINTVHYDPKIKHFFDRVKNLNPEMARFIIKKHLEHICEFLALQQQ